MTSTDERLAKMTMRGGPHPPVDARSLPPGLRWPALAQSAALIRHRHRFVPAMRRRFGEVFTVRLVPEGRPLVLVHRRDHVREVFAGDPAVLHAGKGNAVLGPVMGEHSLLLVDGEQHRRARRLLMPAFATSAMGGYREVVARLAREEVARWPRGRTFASLDRMNALTLEVILQVVFGVVDEDRLARLRPLVRATVDIRPVVLLGWGYPWLQRLKPWREVVDNQRRLDEELYALIAERRVAGDLAGRADVLSRLLLVGADQVAGERPLADDELRDQLVTLLLAGHETTASALSWALYELGRDPSVLRRAQEAADAGDDAFLEAVVKESMRLHPVIPMVVRYLMEPVEVAGRRLPAGVSVGASILLAHSDPEAFPDPEAFRPERFVDGAPAPNTWFPFGGGVRRCIGAGFSLMEGVEVLREVVRGLDVETTHTDRPRVRNITSVPDRGARIAVHPRG